MSFISMIPIVIGTIGLMFINFTGDCPEAGNTEGMFDSHPALRRRAGHSVLKWAKVKDLCPFQRIIFHILRVMSTPPDLINFRGSNMSNIFLNSKKGPSSTL